MSDRKQQIDAKIAKAAKAAKIDSIDRTIELGDRAALGVSTSISERDPSGPETGLGGLGGLGGPGVIPVLRSLHDEARPARMTMLRVERTDDRPHLMSRRSPT